MPTSVTIDFLPESAAKYRRDHVVVVIDVVRATTTAITALATGQRCFPVATVGEGLAIASATPNALLAGEQGGDVPAGFDMNNSPAEVAALDEDNRSIILLSSSGTRLCQQAAFCDEAVLACLRNYTAAARDLIRRGQNVAVIGAGTRGEFREEDQMCCAWIADLLLDAGFLAGDAATLDYVRRWRGAPVDAWTNGKSAGYLQRSGQLRDLDFVLSHIDDLPYSFPLREGEVFMELVPERCLEDVALGGTIGTEVAAYA